MAYKLSFYSLSTNEEGMPMQFKNGANSQANNLARTTQMGLKFFTYSGPLTPPW